MFRVTVMMLRERVESVMLEMLLARLSWVCFLLVCLFCFLIRLACCLETLVASVEVVNLSTHAGVTLPPLHLLLAMLSLSSVSKKDVVSISLLSTELA